MIELPITWMLGTVGLLSSTIATLAAIMWRFLVSRLEAQDKLIAAQVDTIEKLQCEVERMAIGCGMVECHWRQRR